MTYIPRFLILCICALLLTSSALAKKGPGGKRPGGKGPGGKGPGGNNRPEGNKPQGGNRPEGGRGPPGVGIFSLNGSNDPTLLSTIELASQPTMAVVGGSIMAVYHNHTRDERTGVPQLVMSTSSDGTTWSEAQAVTISGLPADVNVTINPTLSSDGQYLYFTGSSGKNLKEGGSAIYVAKNDGSGTSFSGATKAFSMDGAVMIDSAVANGFLIVPHTNKRSNSKDDEGVSDDDDMIPTIARKLLKRKPGKRSPRGSDSAYLAQCSSPSSCTFVQNITMPAQDSKNSFVGSMLYLNGEYQFYGSGPGPWPITSSNAATWSPPATGEKLMARDPSVIVFNGVKIAATPVKHSRPSNSTRPVEPVQNDPVLA